MTKYYLKMDNIMKNMFVVALNDELQAQNEQDESVLPFDRLVSPWAVVSAHVFPLRNSFFQENADGYTVPFPELLKRCISGSVSMYIPAFPSLLGIVTRSSFPVPIP